MCKWLWLLIFFATLIWSGIHPQDFYTWVLEVAPAVIGLALMVATARRFPLTPLLYWLILVHAIVLMVGGHYTYAQVPLFEYIKPAFGFERNYYDKLGHFLQGFVPAMLAREILLRLQVLTSRRWLGFIVVSICLAFSAFYEMIEWWVALLSGAAAEAFLGTQGDTWDTQSDMAFALAGAIAALLVLPRRHDEQLARLARRPA